MDEGLISFAISFFSLNLTLESTQRLRFPDYESRGNIFVFQSHKLKDVKETDNFLSLTHHLFR